MSSDDNNAAASAKNNASEREVTQKDRAVRRKKRRMEARRRAVVVATRALLEEEGAKAMTASNIARACDLTPSGLYYSFDSIDALLSAVHVDLFSEEAKFMGDAFARALATDDDKPSDSPRGFRLIDVMTRAMVAYGVDNPRRWRALHMGAAAFATTSAAMREELLPQADSFFSTLERLLVEDQKAGDLDASAVPRVIANLAYCQAQGILAMLMAAEAGGVATTFTPQVLVDGALETFRRAWWATSE